MSSQLHTDIIEYTNSDVSVFFFVNKILVLLNLTLIELYMYLQVILIYFIHVHCLSM